jgi:gliding motility-associated-like protein
MKLTSTLLSLFIAISAFSQTPLDCETPILGGACYATQNQPEDGSGTLGFTYNNTACGLNYVQASVMTTTRYTPSPGTGYPTTLTIAGIPPCVNIEKAFLWWAGGGTANNANFTFNSTPLVGARVGNHGAKCWNSGGTESYRADVTAQVTGNGNYTFSSPNGNNMDGVTLMIIYTDPTVTYEGSIRIFDGAISAATIATNQTMTGLNVCANSSYGNAFVINSDMQNNVSPTHSCTLNGVTALFPNTFWNFDVTNTPYTAGQTTAPFTVNPTSGDCYLWVMMGTYYQTTTCAVCSTPPPSTLTASSVTGDATCGNCDGTATVTPAGGVPPYTYTWNTTPAQTTPTATNLCPGTYVVTVKDAFCETVLDTVTILQQNAPPAPVINPAGPFCVNDSALNLTASTIGGTWSGTGITNTINGTFNPTTAGGGTHQIIYTDTGLCALKDTINIIVNPLPTIAISNITVCNGDTVPQSNFVSNPIGATYVWSNSNTTIGLAASGTGNTPTFIATNTSNNPIVATITVTPTANGCEGLPVNYTITVNPTPTVTVPANLNYCSGDTVPAFTFVSNPVGGTFTWTNSNTAIGLAASGTGATPTFIATNTGSTAIVSTITVTPTVNGCEGTPVTFTITVNPNNLVAGPGDLICLGDSIILTAANSGLGTITWYDDPNGTNIIGTGTPFYPTVNTTGTYVFYVNEVGGCATNLDSIVIVVKGVNAVINATPTSGLLPLNVFFGNGSTTGSGISYDWSFGTGDTSSLFQPSYIYNNDGSYTVMLIVTDGFCYDTAYVTIEVIKESVIIVPNVFTPNGDGSNDMFKLIELNLKTIEGEIYNRWGQKLYSWNDLNGGWDGKTPSGDFAPDGTYFYIIKATGQDDVQYLKKGSFSLIK